MSHFICKCDFTDSITADSHSDSAVSGTATASPVEVNGIDSLRLGLGTEAAILKYVRLLQDRINI